MIDKINDEFIVDCTNNSKEERQQVYKFLVDNRDYGIEYLSKSYPIIVCNKQYGASNWDTLIQYYNWLLAKKDIPVYTFEQFKEMYLDEFILPKQWMIEVTEENADILTEWRIKISNGYYNGNAKIYTFIFSSGSGMNYLTTTYPVITFEQFKKYVLKENNMKTYTIQELRNAPIQIKVYSEEQAIKLAYAVGHKTDWKPYKAKYPIYCYLDEWDYPSWNSSENEKKSDKPTIIEFNQIKDFMETKKIIGYKLVKPEYKEVVCLIGKWNSIKTFEKIENGYNFSTKSYHYDLLKNAGVLDLWFEPVYEKEFKVGDWVTFWSEIDKKLYSSKIKEWTPHNYCKLENGLEPFKHLIKKATPEEIEKASKTIVKMYSSNKGEFEIEVVDGKAYYRPENKYLPKEWIKSIIGSYHHWRKEVNTNYPYDIKVDGVDVGCYSKTKKEDWEKVYKLLK